MGYDFFLRNLQYCTLSPASSFCSILFKKIKQLYMSMLITEKKFGRGQSRIESVALWVCKVTVVCKLMPVHCIIFWPQIVSRAENLLHYCSFGLNHMCPNLEVNAG